jgi:hypothetical protein
MAAAQDKDRLGFAAKLLLILETFARSDWFVADH